MDDRRAPRVLGVVSSYMAFTREEVEFLQANGLARFATVGPDGQPDVVPVACEFDGSVFWIGGVGEQVLATRKFRNVAAGNEQVALVIDDVVSYDPFTARGIRVYGRAGGVVERVGMVGPGYFMPITPVVSWSWNLEGAPAGDEWYSTGRTEHG